MNKLNKRNKHLFLIAFVFAVFARPASNCFSLVDLGAFQDAANDFNKDIASALPFHAGGGLDWSDAYIGQLLSKKPHFGFGVSAAFSRINSLANERFFGLLDKSFQASSYFVLPAALAGVRLGGILLPFDMGFKFGRFEEIIPLEGAGGAAFKKESVFYGGDLRIAISKGSGAFPKISLGAGYNYFSGKYTASLAGLREFGIGADILSADNPELNLEWQVSSIELKLHVSKKILIFTPYLGSGASFYWSYSGYEISSDNMGYRDWDSIAGDMEGAGIKGIDVDPGKSFSSGVSENSFALRSFGGFSVDLFIFRLNLNLYCGFPNINLGGELALRLQF